MLNVFAERDDLDAYTTELDPGNGGPVVALRMIWEDGWREVLSELERPMSTREIRGDCAIAELPAYPPTNAWRIRIRRPLEGDPRNATGVLELAIFDHQPDGQGLVRFILRRARPPERP
jgi:hypothetical protein